MKASTFLAKILILLILSSTANASQLYSYQERVIICMVALDHADAEQLANTLIRNSPNPTSSFKTV